MITKGQRTLEACGFSDVEHFGAGRWFIAKDTNGELVCFLRQSANAWHAFYEYRATGSGSDPRGALTGGLGDVIDDSRSLMSYKWLVRNAPFALSRRFDGLYEAQSQVVNG